MDSDTALRFDLTPNHDEESPAIVESPTDTPTGFSPQAIDAVENHASAVGIAADEGEAQEEVGDAEHDERAADDEDEDEEESEGEAE
jgi:hypothetical protein